MSTWEDLNSSSFEFDKDVHICLMANIAEGSMSEESDEEIDFFDLDSLRLAHHEIISNNKKITYVTSKFYKIILTSNKNLYTKES